MTDETTSSSMTTPEAAPESSLVASPELSSTDLQAARHRRAGLRRLCLQLDDALTSGDAQAPDRQALTHALGELAECWSLHIAETEAPEGLLNQILSDAPRLATMVDRFRREHPSITGRIAATGDRLADRTADRAEIEQRVKDLLTSIDRHRRGGSELIHRAYNVDIGLGE